MACGAGKGWARKKSFFQLISKNTRRLHHCCCFVRSSIEQAGERARERATCSRSRGSASQEIGTKRRAKSERERDDAIAAGGSRHAVRCGGSPRLQGERENRACGAHELPCVTEARVKAAEGAPRKMFASITSTRHLRSNTAVLTLSGVDMRINRSNTNINNALHRRIRLFTR